MEISKLAHYSIRTTDLEASRRFYTEIMQFRVGFRPPFGFPGLWLYFDDDESEFGVVHIIGTDPNDPIQHSIKKLVVVIVPEIVVPFRRIGLSTGRIVKLIAPHELPANGGLGRRHGPGKQCK